MAVHTLKRRVMLGQPHDWPAGVPDVMQRVYAARGVFQPSDIEQRLAQLLSPTLLGGTQRAAELLCDAILNDERITVAGDYDCDGATGSAVAVRGLRLLGAKHVSFIVPNRFKHGYGLSPGLVADMDPATNLIVTVDSGVSSVEGVATAKGMGMKVLITDHHLPGDYLPAADAIVNPNLRDDTFPSKMLAGVGVMFYVLLVTRSLMRLRGLWTTQEPDLSTLLPLVAVGTVADLVPLDRNNRILVEAGLRRIRSGLAPEGIKALMVAAGVDPERLVSSDIAFHMAPRINAAGRLEDMTVGVQTLMCDDPEESKRLVAQLEKINATRKEKQAEMIEQAEEMVLNMPNTNSTGVTVFNPKWHSGIVGLVASKLKDALHRPVFAFAPAEEGHAEVRGSGRSIAGFHLRDALAVIDSRHPGLILKFGGHAMAAGMSMLAVRVDEFSAAFEQVAAESLDEEQLNSLIYTDGELEGQHLNVDFAQYIRQCGPWGQAFPEPVFENVFQIEDWSVMGEKKNHRRFRFIDPRTDWVTPGVHFFSHDEQKPNDPPEFVRIAYEVSVNRYRERDNLQLMVRHMEPAV